MFRISVTSQNYTAWTCKKKTKKHQTKKKKTNWNKEWPGFIHRKGKQFTKKKKVSLMSHLKIIIIKKKETTFKQHLLYNRNPLGLLCTLRVLGSPTARPCPVQHTRYSSQLPILRCCLRAALTPFPFLLVLYFPRRELHEHF